jgi:hypothetical protein
MPDSAIALLHRNSESRSPSRDSVRVLLCLIALACASGCTVDVCTTTILGPSGLGDGKQHCTHTKIP